MQILFFNFLVKQFRKSKNQYVEFIPLDTDSGFFQKISPDKPGPIEGKINFRLDILHTFYPYRNDTIRFEVQIRDRAGNLSNTVTTDSVVVNWL